MPDSDLIEIKVSRVIPAEKWKIIRLLTKVGDFPSFVPTVKEATVIQKSRNKITTRWHIQVDSVPIKWVEEDTLDLKESSIHFKAIEGDLTEFEGDWTFKEHPEGNEVSVNVKLRVDIPAIKSFAEPYISKMVTRNFEAILEAMERRLISSRYASYKRGDTGKIAGFGIIGHLYNFYHLERSLNLLNPDFKMPSREFIGQLFHITPSFKLFDVLNFKSKTGQTVNGCFIIATFIPDMIENDIWAVFSKVVKACKIAEKHGIGIVTLGGFTSIVAERTGREIASEVNVPVTTGNSFTAAMAIDGVLKAAELLNLDLAKAKLAIIGGTGDIGSACARGLVDKVRQLTITGRTKANLVRLRGELSKRRKARVFATTDNEAAVKDADIIIATASAVASILKIDSFKPGAIICDVGYPKNISYTHTNRQDVFIFSGGLAKPPTPLAIPFDIGLPSPEAIYGCFSESIILALEKRYENFSFGRGNITPEKIEEIRQLGKKHGFEVADFYWGDKLIGAPIIENVKQKIHENKTDRAG
jgi:predicted amino acid dehydrogenase/ribosome-associated toxin RatA of RatAB toxin-antitoxin module